MTESLLLLKSTEKVLPALNGREKFENVSM